MITMQSFPLLPPDMDRAALREHMMATMMMRAIAWMSPEAHDYIKVQAADFHKVHAARPR